MICIEPCLNDAVCQPVNTQKRPCPVSPIHAALQYIQQHIARETQAQWQCMTPCRRPCLSVKVAHACVAYLVSCETSAGSVLILLFASFNAPRECARLSVSAGKANRPTPVMSRSVREDRDAMVPGGKDAAPGTPVYTHIHRHTCTHQ